MTTFPTNIGVSHLRRDLRDKLTGAAKYAADVQLAGYADGRGTPQPASPRSDSVG